MMNKTAKKFKLLLFLLPGTIPDIAVPEVTALKPNFRKLLTTA